MTTSFISEDTKVSDYSNAVEDFSEFTSGPLPIHRKYNSSSLGKLIEKTD